MELLASGDLHVIRWARSTGAILSRQSFWDCALDHGQQAVLEWMHASFPVQSNMWRRQLRSVAWASRPWALSTLRWLRSIGTQDCVLCEYSFVAAAAFGGEIETIAWLVDRGGRCGAETAAAAAGSGSLPLLQWLRMHDCAFNATACAAAARGGHLEVLRSLREQGVPWDDGTCASGAIGGNIALIEWARSQGAPWSPQCCAYAAGCGQLQTLKWLRQQGCPWDASTCCSAAADCHFEILRWAYENGCPLDARDCLRSFHHEQCPEMAVWLLELQEKDSLGSAL
jgi:hypothetical protein